MAAEEINAGGVGEVIEYSDMLSGSDLAGEFQYPGSPSSMSLLVEDYFKNTQTCTHLHTCNLPGPDGSQHTHTCYHTHTQFIPPELGSEECAEVDGWTEGAEEDGKKKKRPLGNREAVRKYREKKKAQTVYLEEQVKQLKSANQQLLKRLQGQAALEAEVVRLRTLLADLRARIDGEIGAFPYKRHRAALVGDSRARDCGACLVNSAPMSCGEDVGCPNDLLSSDDYNASRSDRHCDMLSVGCQSNLVGDSNTSSRRGKRSSSCNMQLPFAPCTK